MLGAATVAMAVSALADTAASDGTIETVTVTGQAFTADIKGRAPLMETPQNIQLISSDLLQAQSVSRLDDALRNVAGVMGGGYYASYDYFRIRGFDASGYIYLDGMRVDTYVDVLSELSGLEQIQVVKGPASALYGQGALGGLVNFVSKRPTDKSFLNIDASYGSYDSYELSLDGNLPVSSNAGGRLVALMRHTGNFVKDAAGDNRIYLAPSFSWRIDDDTALTLLASYQHDRMNIAMPLTALGTIEPSQFGTYPRNINTSNLGNTNRSTANRTQLGYQFDHRINSIFSFSNRLRYSINDKDWDNVLYTSSLSSDGRYLSRYPYDYEGFGGMLSTDTSLSADFDTGPLKHHVMVGTDYYSSRDHSHSRQIDYSDPDSYMVLDLYNPVYHQPLTKYATYASSTERSHDIGAYLQDHVVYGPLTLTGSVRWDEAYDNSDGTRRTDVAITPRLGATYAVLPNNVLFASYSESFLPQSGTTFAGEMLKPETGRQWETGIKSSLMDGRIDLTASLYYLTRNNVSTSDPGHAFYYLQSGKQRSRGFELDSRFQIQENWQAILTYAYTEAVVVKDNDAPKGDQLRNVPLNSIGAWSRYAFDGMLKGVAVSGGVYHYSSSAGDVPNSFRLPDYTLADAALSYTYGPGEIQLSVKNLFNERYFSGSYSNTYVQPGFPRMLKVDLKVAL